MLLALFSFQIIFTDYYGRSIEADVTFPGKRYCPNGAFHAVINGTKGMYQLDSLSGQLTEYEGWKHLNYFFFVRDISISDETPFKLAETVVRKLFEYTIPTQYAGGKYTFSRRFWSWNEIKDAWSFFIGH